MNSPAAPRGIRQGTPDLLKGVAVLLMIQVHLTEQFATPDFYSGTAGKISLFLGGPLCAPVFLAVMGYFLASPGKPARYFLKRGLILFLGGILLNTARSAHLLAMIFTGRSDLDPLPYLLGVDILTLAGMSLALTGLLRLWFRSHPLPWAFTALIVPLAAPWMPQPAEPASATSYGLSFLWGHAPWAYFPLFPWYGYVAAGYLYRLLASRYPLIASFDFSRKYSQLIPVWAGLLVTFPWAFSVTAELESPDGYYHHGILFFGWTLFFLATWLPAAHALQMKSGHTRILRLVKWTGRHVTVLYILQWLLIGNLAPLLYRTQGALSLAGWFFAVTGVTCFIGWLFLRLRNSFPRI